MIVLPKSFERYLSALRNFTSRCVLKHGLMSNHLKNLEKINIAEALYHKNTLESVDINKLCQNLLGAVRTLKKQFAFSVAVKGNYLVNKKLFVFLLLSIAKNDNLKIELEDAFLKIGFSGDGVPASPFISALGGLILKEIKTEQNLVLIPITPTLRESVYVETEWEYLFDKFSEVNIIFHDESHISH